MGNSQVKGRDWRTDPEMAAKDGGPVIRNQNQGMVIQKGVPGPMYWSRGLSLLLRNMEEVGDSVFVPGRAAPSTSTLVKRLRARMAEDGVVRRWSVRAVEGGVRVWRME